MEKKRRVQSVHWLVLFKHLKVAKRVDSTHTFWFHFGAKNIQNTIPKSIQKSMPKKSWKSKKDEKTELWFDCFRNCFPRKKSKCLKKVHVRRLFEFISRMRVTEGSPKKKESKQKKDIYKNFSQKQFAKKKGALRDKPSPNWCQNHEKSFTKVDVEKMQKKWKWGGDGITPHPSRHTPISKILRR